MKTLYIKLILLALWLTGLQALCARDIQICSSCEYQAIKPAIKAAQAGDRLHVQKGVYKEGVILIDKPLELIGHNRPTIDGQGKGHVLYIRADHVRIENFIIQHSGQSYISDFAGIRAEHVSNCVFANNILRANTYSIYFEKVSHSQIIGNQLIGNAENEVTAGNGVHLFYSDHITVSNNTIQGQRDGLYFEFTEDSEVIGNHSHHNLRFGMHFMFSHRNNFYDNTYDHNPTGVAIMYSRRLDVRRNIFSQSKGNSSFGFLIKEITDSSFISNTFKENTLGIMLNASNRNLFKRNLFELNGWAAEIYSNSYDNLFTENNFIANNFDVTTNSTRNTNKFEGNYWDSYRGYDFTGDAVGDISYRPVNVFSFWVARYPELAILLNSPVVRFLEMSEHFFPVITPRSLEDESPRMSAIPLTGPTQSSQKEIRNAKQATASI